MASEHETHLASELVLFIDNDSTMYQQITAVKNNLAMHFIKGKFEPAKAVKGLKHVTDNGAKKYLFDVDGVRPRQRTYGWGASQWWNVAGFGQFTPAIRKLAAAELLDEYLGEIFETAYELIDKYGYGGIAKGIDAGEPVYLEFLKQLENLAPDQQRYEEDLVLIDRAGMEKREPTWRRKSPASRRK